MRKSLKLAFLGSRKIIKQIIASSVLKIRTSKITLFLPIVGVKIMSKLCQYADSLYLPTFSDTFQHLPISNNLTSMAGYDQISGSLTQYWSYPTPQSQAGWDPHTWQRSGSGKDTKLKDIIWYHIDIILISYWYHMISYLIEIHGISQNMLRFPLFQPLFGGEKQEWSIQSWSPKRCHLWSRWKLMQNWKVMQKIKLENSFSAAIG